jgi:hypothetical protein
MRFKIILGLKVKDGNDEYINVIYNVDNFGYNFKERFKKELNEFCTKENILEDEVLNFYELCSQTELQQIPIFLNFEEAKEIELLKNKREIIILVNKDIIEKLLTIKISKKLEKIVYSFDKDLFLQLWREQNYVYDFNLK